MKPPFNNTLLLIATLRYGMIFPTYSALPLALHHSIFRKYNPIYSVCEKSQVLTPLHLRAEIPHLRYRIAFGFPSQIPRLPHPLSYHISITSYTPTHADSPKLSHIYTKNEYGVQMYISDNP